MIRMQMQRFDELGWKQKLGIVLGVTVTLALAVGLIILATAVAIVLLPVVIVGALIARWRFNRMLNEARARAGRGSAPPRRRPARDRRRLRDRQRRRPAATVDQTASGFCSSALLL